MFSNFQAKPTMIILLLLVCVLFYTLYTDFILENNEQFTIYDYPKYCKDCGFLNKVNCNNCVDCGYCITSDGRGSCVPGDANGPYFASDCMEYRYGVDYNMYPYDGIYPLNRYYPYHYYSSSTYPSNRFYEKNHNYHWPNRRFSIGSSKRYGGRQDRSSVGSGKRPGGRHDRGSVGSGKRSGGRHDRASVGSGKRTGGQSGRR